MFSPRQSAIRRARRQSILYNLITSALRQKALDDPSLNPLVITRVELSPSGGMIHIFCTHPDGKAGYEKIRPQLVLYRPSLRAAIAQELQGHVTPHIRFQFDAQRIKQERIEALLDRVKGS